MSDTSELITRAEAAIKLYEDAGVSGEAGANLIADLISALKASEAQVEKAKSQLALITYVSTDASASSVATLALAELTGERND